ncbi:ABC-type polysaccharide/polyol phosphate export permease [Nocardioides cavernae]|uniref:Transport permease protein n=1 Tax=Nocardioides cavernae TaxID=1921566 RepID=A0A7Y9H1C4_9ACTN|nr:ABC transporter permease [Nocardioides cavernae]NYE36128.1 ABC-type polysaccharide/polyol phosphate export permease [Nocardioides cavernae]
MTTAITTATTTTPQPHRDRPLERARWVVADTWVVARRHLLRLVRRPDELLGTLLVPVMAVVMFGFVFGDALGIAMGVPSADYREFLLPGLFALTMAFGIGTTTIAVASDVRGGVLDRMQTLPMAPVAVLAGRVLADVLTAVVELGLLMGLGSLVGWQWHGGAGAVAGAVGLLLLLRLMFSSVGILLGLLVSGPEAAMKYFALVFPLALVADTVVPTALMPAWLSGIAAWNPLSITVTSTRELFGNPTATPTSWVVEHASALAAGLPILLTSLCVALALLRFRRSVR